MQFSQRKAIFCWGCCHFSSFPFLSLPLLSLLFFKFSSHFVLVIIVICRMLLLLLLLVLLLLLLLVVVLVVVVILLLQLQGLGSKALQSWGFSAIALGSALLAIIYKLAPDQVTRTVPHADTRTDTRTRDLTTPAVPYHNIDMQNSATQHGDNQCSAVQCSAVHWF